MSPTNIDPFGLSPDEGRGGPTELEAAYMAHHIYTADDSSIGKELSDEFGGWKLESIAYNLKGLKIGVYYRTINGVTSYAVVNRGSDTGRDWLNNLAQPFGLSLAMRKSINYANEFVTNHPDAHITFIGHSKGGAEALANALATNKDAIVFNPAIPNYEIYGLDASTYTAKATSYVVTGEVLSTAYLGAEAIALNPHTPMTPWLLDDTIAVASRYIFDSSTFWQTIPLKNPEGNIVEDHKMAKVKIALKDYLKEKSAEN